MTLNARRLPHLRLTSHIRAIHQSMSSNLRQRAVVSSFICTPPSSPNGLTFALFKRSQDVNTYQGKWAVCSGSIDPTDTSPEAAAKREIREETTLSDSDITLLRKGKPFSLTDEGLNTRWTIHPFAWQLKPGAIDIKFDWEHTEYRFVRPEDVKTYDHVPQLEVGMERVLVSPETEEALAILRNDHDSGAQALAIKALELLRKAVMGSELSGLETSEEFWRELRWRAWHFAKNGRPSMGAAIEAEILKALDSVSKQLVSPGSEGVGGIPLSNLKSLTESAIHERILASQHSLDDLALHCVKFMESNSTAPDTNIVTLSSSGSITRSLAKFVETRTKKGRNVKITVLESRPSFEGVAFVNNLLASFKEDEAFHSRLRIEIVSDASIATVFNDAHFLVFGGDKVLPNGDVSNKIGTLVAAILSEEMNPGCKVLALFTTNKITSAGFDSEHRNVEYNDPKELTDAWPESYRQQLKENQENGYQVEVKNAYFEWVRLGRIDQHITEVGLLEAEDIARLAKESEELENRIFGDL
ncbi:nagb/rpia/CoA transferase-like protein [Hyaloscypha variabilis F]|uniref:Nagb/rpia/CoA transferase-like protein n=1 Tax=Hyaloscypha variabilis (strain UAMH 11265 / GT02V1 / F) TaxID=1149755 RepID=A0A2J6RTU2_HYAVF|nr:nagb/rpia/CoA transferase-like protein [Hyaloscypha variabilis F]